MSNFWPPEWMPILIPFECDPQLLAQAMPRPLTAEELALPAWLRRIPQISVSELPVVDQGLADFVMGMTRECDFLREREFCRRRGIRQLPNIPAPSNVAQNVNSSGQTRSSSAVAQGRTLIRTALNNSQRANPYSAPMHTPALNRPRSFNSSGQAHSSAAAAAAQGRTLSWTALNNSERSNSSSAPSHTPALSRPTNFNNLAEHDSSTSLKRARNAEGHESYAAAASSGKPAKGARNVGGHESNDDAAVSNTKPAKRARHDAADESNAAVASSTRPAKRPRHGAADESYDDPTVSNVKPAKGARKSAADESDYSAESKGKPIKKARKQKAAPAPHPSPRQNTAHQSSSKPTRVSVWDRQWNRHTAEALGLSAVPTGPPSNAPQIISAVAAQSPPIQPSPAQVSSLQVLDRVANESDEDESDSEVEVLPISKDSRPAKRPRYPPNEDDDYSDAAPNAGPTHKKSKTNTSQSQKQNQPKRQGGSAGNSPGKSPPGKKRDSWSDEEHNALAEVLRIIREVEKDNGLVGLRDVQLWTTASQTLLIQYSIDRTYTACKNYWSRMGRERSGFDERANPDPQNLSTSLQKTKGT